MNPSNEIVCIGDLMLESILRVPSLPYPNSTLVTDGKPWEVGGTAFNLAWYFSQWGWQPKLAVVTGSADAGLVSTAFGEASVSVDHLITTAGDADHLLVLVDDAGQLWAAYLRAHLAVDAEPRLLDLCAHSEVLVITGSRHARLRAASLEAARKFSGKLLAFSPSYALYEYSEAEILTLCQAAHVVILNKNELAFTLSRTRTMDAVEFARHLSGTLLVTQEDRGAVLYQQDGVLTFPSLSNRKGDVIGAGDAFFAAYLHARLRGGSAGDAGQLASLVAARQIESTRVRARIAIETLEEQVRISAKPRTPVAS